jgi:hypothetical protein
VLIGIPRFISSDYSADFTKTAPGGNRNLDLRREFMARADRMPIIQPRIHRVLQWGDADQPLDFTTKDNVAAYVADAAIDETTPRVLRIAGDTLSARGIAAAMSELTGERYRTLRVGGMSSLGVLTRVAKLVAPQPRAAFRRGKACSTCATCSAAEASSICSITIAIETFSGHQSRNICSAGSMSSTDAGSESPIQDHGMTAGDWGNAYPLNWA